ncbi:MAG: hypothetical protein UR60_C0019G0010 [Candidatus Moranbacteria bacterium GW2011_GWF2_34_56]|nr:MAG: hypothetical protein UR51_C0006G0029 [Candidatus Moranbacteria bacterium GW2011_GWF1_34_10]KKP64555.1 MAG: hypothetical protein UR60_C0019G0010 [Candidatus Moranbacteria bacterium GW2011_GWF2_34_56]HBI16672.1 hypothetical protein [Candidatus Moranbacteria bacterium]
MNLNKEVSISVRRLHCFEEDGMGNLRIPAGVFRERLEQWDFQCSYIAFLSISLLDSKLGLSILIAPPMSWDYMEGSSCATGELFRSLYGYGQEGTYAIGDPPILYRGTLRLEGEKLEISNRYQNCAKKGFWERDLRELEIFKQEISQACGVSEITFLDLR